MRRLWDQIRQWVLECAQGQSWVFRLPVWLFCVYLLGRFISDSQYASIFSGLNLGIHEFGHLIFSPFGLTLNIAGGTIVECAVPLYSFWLFIQQRDAFAPTFSFAWLSTSLFDVAHYMADARTMELQLVSPFGADAYHDWNYLLDRFGLLSYDQTIAAIVRVAAYLSLTISVLYGGWVLWLMAHQEQEG